MEELAKELMEAPSCCEEARNACKKYLDSIGTPSEEECLEELIKEVKEDINTIDDTIGFMKSDVALNMLGEETRNMLLEKSLKAKENGAMYCDCPACAAAERIINLSEK